MSKIRAGTKICPKIGSYKGETVTVTKVSRVSRGNRKLGTRTGMTVYFAGKHGGSDVFYARKDFKAGPCER